eukprot:COSAG05_NODE_178_length_14897_cov_619.335248_2_plen_120_part_00
MTEGKARLVTLTRTTSLPTRMCISGQDKEEVDQQSSDSFPEDGGGDDDGICPVGMGCQDVVSFLRVTMVVFLPSLSSTLWSQYQPQALSVYWSQCEPAGNDSKKSSRFRLASILAGFWF